MKVEMNPNVEGKEVFGGDWHGNLEKLFWESLRRWGNVGE